MAKKQFPISVVISAVDQITAPLKKINERIEKTFQVKKFRQLGRSLNAFSEASGFPKIAGAVKNVGSSLGNVADKFGDIATKAALVGGGIAAGLVAITRSTANTGDALRDFEKQTGFSADRVQELNYISSQTGGPEDMSDVIRTLTQNYGRLQAGTGKLATFLKKVSPPLYQQVKAAKSSEDAFDILLNAMRKVQDPARRTALAVAAFGPEGAKLSEMADEGADSLEAMRKRAHELGLVMGKEAREDANSFNDSFAEMVQVLEGVKKTIGKALMPVIKEYLDAIVEFVRANRGQIVEFAKSFAAAVKEMVPVIVNFAKQFLSYFVSFDEASKKFSLNMGNVKLALVAIAAVMLGPFLAAVATMTSAFITLGIAIATTPFGWVALAIAGIVAALAALYIWWDPIVSFFKEWGGLLLTIGGTILAFVSGPIGALVAAAGFVLQNWQPISDFFVSLWNKVKAVGSFIGGIFGGGGSATDGASPAASATSVSPAERMISQAGSGVMQSQAQVNVKFDNLPSGARVGTSTQGPLDFGLEMNKGPLLAPF